MEDHVYRTEKSPKLRRVVSAFVLACAIIAGLYLNNAKATQTSEAPATTGGTSITTAQDAQLVKYHSATEALAALPIKGRAPKTGYARTQFGNGWEKSGGCDTRNRILARDLNDVTYQMNSCVVSSGTLQDPYTGKRIPFVRGADTSAAIQIDHVVALSDSWQKGAQLLTPALRQKMANDSLELLAVDGPANQNKGDGDSATWLPPNKAFRCTYVARQISVKVKYSLWVTSAEHDAMATILKTCPNEPLAT